MLNVEAALTTQQAQALADVTLNLKYLQKTVSFSLAIDHIDLEPGDILTIPLYNVNKRVMLTKVSLGSNLLLQCEAVTQEDGLMDFLVQNPSFADLSKGYGGVFDQTYLALLKIPKIRESDPDTLLYFGAGGGGQKLDDCLPERQPRRTNWDTLAQTTAESTLGIAHQFCWYQYQR